MTVLTRSPFACSNSLAASGESGEKNTHTVASSAVVEPSVIAINATYLMKNSSHHKGTKDTKGLIDEPTNTELESTDIEVEDKAEPERRHPEIGQDLSFVNGEKLIDGLEFDDH